MTKHKEDLPKYKGKGSTRVIIGGSEKFDKPKLMKKKMNLLTIKLGHIEVVSSGQITRTGKKHDDWMGAARHGEMWATKYADRYWCYAAYGIEKYELMAEFADVAVIFYGKNKDDETKRLLQAIKKAKLPLRIIRY